MAEVGNIAELNQYDRLLGALADPTSDSVGIAEELIDVANITGLPESEVADLELTAFRQLVVNLSTPSGTVSVGHRLRLTQVAATLGVRPEEIPASTSIPVTRRTNTMVPQQPAQIAPALAHIQQVAVQVNVPAPSPSTVVVLNQGDGTPSFLIRAFWFLFVGWWLSFWWIAVAWLLNLTIIGLPLGLMMINRIPSVLTLQGAKKEVSVTHQNGVTLVQTKAVDQLPLLTRAIYFVLIGWWASLALAVIAWGLSVLIITLPIGLLIFNLLPQITTLRRT